MQPAITPAVRRFHKKSRTGCKKCKARKIKCDERHPACLNCISHGVKCPYLETLNDDNPRVSTRPKPPVSGGTSSTSSTSTILTPESERNYNPMEVDLTFESVSSTESDHIVELELLHHFTFHTYSTLTRETAVQEFWRTTAVQVGLKCDYIMQALLAVSALHLAYQTPDKRDLYIGRGVKLHRKASRSAVRFMDKTDINTDEAINLFLFSSLTMLFALACPRDHSLSPASPSSTTSAVFPEWAFLLNETKSLTNILSPQAAHHPVLKSFLAHSVSRWNFARETILITCFPDRPNVTSQATNSWGGLGTLFFNGNTDHPPLVPFHSTIDSTGLEQSALQILRRHVTNSITLASVLASPDPTIRTTFSETSNPPPSSIAHLLQIYTRALDELDLFFVYTSSLPLDPQDATLWLWEVSDTLIPLLKHRPPAQEAVAIFAHFAILLKRYEDEGKVWWVQGWAKHIVQQAHDVLDEVHKPWIVWPMREVGLDFDFAGGGIRNTMFISLV